MKTIIKNSIIFSAVVFGLASCGENSWNDTYLKGFEGGADLSNVQNLEYTLTADDYKNLASNSANVERAKADNVSEELESVATLHYFNSAISPADYIPSFLSDPKFQYFTLSEGSAINVTYKIAKNLPEELVGLNAAKQWSLSEEDYQGVYGSDENYAPAFSPSHSASKNLPNMLSQKYPDAVSGDYVVVNYSSTNTDPNFGASDEKDEFVESDVLGAIASGDNIQVNGIVTGICNQGFILTDKGGSILVYIGKSFDKNSYALGDQLEVSGAVSSYNKGFQLPATSIINQVGTSTVSYPAPKVVTGADMDQAITRTDDATAEYVQFTGKLSISGNYYNITVAGATTAIGSLYQFPADLFPALENDGEYVFTGYFTSISSGKYYNILATDITPATAKSSAPKKVVNVEATSHYAVYKYDGSTWSVPSNVDVLQPEDYTEMGSKYGNLQDDQPDSYLPLYLSKKYPYAAADDSKIILYRYYTGGKTVLRSSEYTFDGMAWVNSITDGGVVSETNQFVYRNGEWKMDPSIILVLPVGKNQATSTWFYQAVVDWVKENVENASNFVDSYGTAEYYSGCSSYQGNVNINTTYAAISGNSDYSGMTQEEIETVMKKRFETETAPGALSNLYPNMA
ncbi:MAG: hypothetical protein K2O47_07035, partial [Muribaculaceae bacterium]|nr:hypothetical protein [Muribaculaceae bacterium]